MKITITDKKEKQAITFPCLMILKKEEEVTSKDLVVLFDDDTSGLILQNNNIDDYNHKIGMYITDWEISQFELFNGSIILEND